MFAYNGDRAEDVLDAPLQLAVAHVRDQPGEMFRDRPLGGGDGHGVVVQDDGEVSPGGVVVEGLQGQAAGQGAVADDGDHLEILAFEIPGRGQAQSHGNGGAGVPHGIAVVGAFLRRGIAAEAVFLAQGGEKLPAAGQDLMGVGLVAGVPDQLVLGRVVNVMQSHGDLHRAQAGSQVSAGLGDGPDYLAPELGAKRGQLVHRELPEIRGSLHAVQHGSCVLLVRGHPIPRCRKRRSRFPRLSPCRRSLSGVSRPWPWPPSARRRRRPRA